MSDPYLLLKLVHIVSGALLFGTGLGTAFQMWTAHLTGDPRVIAAVAGRVVWADWLFTLPSGIVQPVTGIGLAHLGGYSLDEPWLVAAMALYLLALACWLPVVWLQMRARDLARAAAAEQVTLPPRYQRIMRAWFILGWPAFLALLAVYALMVLKPPLWPAG